MSIQSVMPSNHPILCCPLLLLPSIFPSICVSSNESVPCIRWPKYWSFSFSISPSNEYSGLIFFRMDCFVLFAVQGTLKSLFQHHSSKASILWHSAFFIVQLSHPYMTTGKTIALTRPLTRLRTFVGNVMSLLFNMLSRLVEYGDSLKNWKIELPYGLAIPVRGIYPEKNMIWKEMWKPVFTAALFTIAKTWKQTKCPLTTTDKEDAGHIYNGILLSP